MEPQGTVGWETRCSIRQQHIPPVKGDTYASMVLMAASYFGKVEARVRFPLEAPISMALRCKVHGGTYNPYNP